MPTITIRTDTEIEAAIDELVHRFGGTRSDVVRKAVLDAQRESRRAALRAEAEALRDDPEDAAAARALAAEMGTLGAW